MTLLVVLVIVVIATILAALYLSLKSGRGDEPGPGWAGASDRQASGGSRSGGSASLVGRVRAMADRGQAAGSSRRRFGGDDEDDVPDYVTARRSSRRAGGDRSSLVRAGTGHRADGRTAAGFDETDPALHAAYGCGAAGYDGYDAAADTRVSGPMGAEPGTGPYATGGYDTGAYDAGSGPSPGHGSETPGGYSVRDRAGERGRDPGSPRGRYPGSAPEGPGGGMYPPPDPYSPEDPAGSDFGAPGARTPRGHARPGGRRRSGAPDSAPPAHYDDTPTALTNSPFSSASGADFPPDDTGEAGDSSPGGRRRIAQVQKPQLRMGRSRQDYDNDPWPSAEEIDGVSDDQFWSDLSSDKPLATTARAAQAPSDSGQPWAPGDGPGRPGPSAGPDSADMVSAPVPADAPAMGRGRRARGRAAEPEDGTGPRPRQQADGEAGGAVGPDRPGGPGGTAGPGASGAGTAGPGASGGSRRRAEPMRSPRGAEEDPLTGASFSRHARKASDNRSYPGSRQAQRPSHDRPDASADETQTMRSDPRGYGAPGPAGAPGSGSHPVRARRGAPGPGGRPGRPNAPTGPNAAGGPASSGDPRGDGGYRTGARPAGSYPEGTGGYEPPARGSRHASPPGGGRPSAGNGRPPAASGQRPPRPALPGPVSGGPSYAPPGYPDPHSPRTNGSSAYPGTNRNSPSSGSNGGSAYPGGNGDSPYPGTYGDSPQPGGAGGAGGSGGYPRGRRSSNRDHRRPDDPYEGPY